ncbi:MAG: sugar phosphate isomerase/epimerase family protein [Coprococcus sp.]
MLENGIEFAEISMCWDNTVLDAEKMAEDVLKTGIKIWSIHIPFGPIPEWDPSNWIEDERNGTVKRILPYFELAKKTGACRLVLHTSFEPVENDERSKRIDAFKRTLDELEKQSVETGVLLCVENLPRTCMGNTGQEMLQLLEDHPNCYICCDTNHMLQETTEAFIEKCLEKIKTLHISDYDGVDERHWLPGEGIICWKKVAELLRNYDGVYMMELKGHKDGSIYTPEEAAKALKNVLMMK